MIRTIAVMGTIVSIEVDASEVAVTQAFEWFRQVEAVCSRFDPCSELRRLPVGIPTPASAILYEAVSFALKVAAATDGAFDPTLGSRMTARGYNRHYLTRAVTDAPGAPGQFLRQRSRWFGGFLTTLFANKAMVGQPRFGGMGRVLLPVKVIDTLLPVFAALAQVSLVVLLIRGSFLSWPLIALIGGKLLFDLTMHLWAMRLYARWLEIPCTAGWMAASLAATLLEPFCFQPLRYFGALAGWVAFLRNRFSWESQRLEAGAAPVAEQTPS